jgi:hypothetical protein
MAASEELLGGLHERIATYLVKKIDGATDDIDKDFVPAEVDSEGVVIKPAEVPRTISAAELACAIALCKNSNITAQKAKGSALDDLKKQLAARGAIKPSEADIAGAMERVEFNGVH